MLVPWEDAPGEISTYDWRDYLSKREYVALPYSIVGGIVGTLLTDG